MQVLLLRQSSFAQVKQKIAITVFELELTNII